MKTSVFGWIVALTLPWIAACTTGGSGTEEDYPPGDGDDDKTIPQGDEDVPIMEDGDEPGEDGDEPLPDGDTDPEESLTDGDEPDPDGDREDEEQPPDEDGDLEDPETEEEDEQETEFGFWETATRWAVSGGDVQSPNFRLRFSVEAPGLAGSSQSPNFTLQNPSIQWRSTNP